MANLCSFSMVVKGGKENIESFYKALSQEGNIWIGRGAKAELSFDNENRAYINGGCKWSVKSSLYYNAISMRNEPEKWGFGDGIDISTLEILTLQEACEKWHLDFEVFSEEDGTGFQEHILVVDGEKICNESAGFAEYIIDGYQTKEEAESELNITITEDEWNNNDFSIRRGGYKWDFEI